MTSISFLFLQIKSISRSNSFKLKDYLLHIHHQRNSRPQKKLIVCIVCNKSLIDDLYIKFATKQIIIIIIMTMMMMAKMRCQWLNKIKFSFFGYEVVREERLLGSQPEQSVILETLNLTFKKNMKIQEEFKDPESNKIFT